MSDDIKNPFLDGSEEHPAEPHVYKPKKYSSAPKPKENTPPITPKTSSSPDKAVETTPNVSLQFKEEPAPTISADRPKPVPQKPAFQTAPVTPPAPSKPNFATKPRTAPAKPEIRQRSEAAPSPFTPAKPVTSSTPPNPEKTSQPTQQTAATPSGSIAGLAVDAIAAAAAIAFTVLLLQEVLPFLK